MATVRALNNALGVPPSAVRIVSGQRARTKVVVVEPAEPDALAALLQG